MGGIPTPDSSLIPQLPALVGFGTAFVLGWFVHRQLGLLAQWRQRWVGHLAIGVALSVACLTVPGIKLGTTAAWLHHGSTWGAAVYAGCYMVSVWYWSFGLIGARKCYGKTVALDGVELEVRPGELLAVLGPNGAGKSTAIALWLGLLQADEGDVRLLGRSPFEVDSWRYAKLSAGQKRQAQFAMAVVGRPKLLFLDEPTASSCSPKDGSSPRAASKRCVPS